MRIADDTEHTLISGQNGSGKTVAGIWNLSQRSITDRPWIVIDTKGDELIGQIPYRQIMSDFEVPKTPGVHVIQPVPGIDDDKIEELLFKIWQATNIGTYIDEGYNLPKNSKWFRALLTQGRSRRNPIIVLTQRPVHIERFAVSEASHHQAFFMSDKSDRERVREYVPHDEIMEVDLPRYHSWYYSVKEREFTGLKPVLNPERIVETFRMRLEPLYKRQQFDKRKKVFFI